MHESKESYGAFTGTSCAGASLARRRAIDVCLCKMCAHQQPWTNFATEYICLASGYEIRPLTTVIPPSGGCFKSPDPVVNRMFFCRRFKLILLKQHLLKLYLRTLNLQELNLLKLQLPKLRLLKLNLLQLNLPTSSLLKLNYTC